MHVTKDQLSEIVGRSSRQGIKRVVALPKLNNNLSKTGKQQSSLQESKNNKKNNSAECSHNLKSKTSTIPPLPDEAKSWKRLQDLKKQHSYPTERICSLILERLPPNGAGSTARSFIFRGGIVGLCKDSMEVFNAHIRHMHEKGSLVVIDGKTLGRRGIRLIRPSGRM
jgi:hypothetical protein